MVVTPKSVLTEGVLLKVVDWVAGKLSSAKSTLPSPLKVNKDVRRSFCCGKWNTKEQVFPASEAGMSKLKIVEMVAVTSTLNWVPAAVLGEEESIGMMRWGNSKLPETRLVLHGVLVRDGPGVLVWAGTGEVSWPRLLGPGVHTVSWTVTTTDGLPGGLPGGLAVEVGEAGGVLSLTDNDAEGTHWSAVRVTWKQSVTSLGGGFV